MYRAVIWNSKNDILEVGDETLVGKWLEDESLLIWLDSFDNEIIEEKELFAKKFSIDEYAISDSQRTRHQPKIEIFKNSELILLKELREAQVNNLSTTIQLALLTGDRFLITRRTGSSPVVDALWARINTSKPISLSSPRSLALKLSQDVADKYIQQLLKTEEQLDEVEQKILYSPNDQLLSTLISYQSQLRKTYRVLHYHKEIFLHQNQKQFDRAGQITKTQWNNVYEHTERSHSLAHLYYELSSDLIDGHISLSSHRLNQIMKVLTIFTVIFVPLSFLAGIYGMNFENIPELKTRYGYFILLGVMLAIATVLLIIFKRKKWLTF